MCSKKVMSSFSSSSRVSNSFHKIVEEFSYMEKYFVVPESGTAAIQNITVQPECHKHENIDEVNGAPSSMRDSKH